MNDKNSKIFNFLTKFITYAFCIFLAIILLMVVFYFPTISFQLQKSFVQYNIIFLIIAIIAATLFILIGLKFSNIFSKLEKINWRKFLIVASVVLFVLQLLIFLNKIFIAGWDVQKIYFTSEYDSFYFSQYPNNLFLKGLFLKMSYIFEFSGISNLYIQLCQAVFPWSNIANGLTAQSAAEYCSYFLAIIINFMMTIFTVIFISCIIKKYKSKKIAILTYIFASVFIGLMPWILVPYSDIFTMFNTALILFLYICIDKKHIKWPLIVFVAIIGFNVKPTSILCIIAIAFTSVIYYIFKKKPKFDLKKFVTTILLCLCSIFIGLTLTFFFKNTTNINIDQNKEYGWTHFLMMGLNEEANGFYNDKDIYVSSTCNNAQERKDKNIEEINNRLNEMGPYRTAQLFLNKLLNNYSDGTFMWEMDAGSGFSVLDVTKNQVIDNFHKNYGPLAQVLWFIVLIGCCLNLLNKKPRRALIVICLTLFMLSIFLMIFECGARYQIQYLSYFIIMSLFGWCNLFGIIRAKLLIKK